MITSLAFFLGLALGIIVGSLGATVAHLQQEIEDAEHNGHRR